MMVFFRRFSPGLVFAAALASAAGCNQDPPPGSSDTSTGTTDEIGDGDTFASDSSTSDGSTSESDTTESTTESTTDTTDTTESETTAVTSGEDGDCAGPCGDPSCGECPDAAMIEIPGNYSIGATEVRKGDYTAFLDVWFSSEFMVSWLPAECGWKVDFTPDGWPGNPNPDLPIIEVDWCDAWAYCEWSGGHLCGAVGGGPATTTDAQDPTSNQWYKACSGGGIKNYPYALAYVPDACNGLEAGFGQILAAGSYPTCEGGYPGVYDMSGNIWEWENACNVDQECRRRSGSYLSDAQILRCAGYSFRARDFRDSNLGIRCCDTP